MYGVLPEIMTDFKYNLLMDIDIRYRIAVLAGIGYEVGRFGARKREIEMGRMKRIGRGLAYGVIGVGIGALFVLP